MSTKVIVVLVILGCIIWVMSAFVFIGVCIHAKINEVDIDKILPLYKKEAEHIIVGQYHHNNFYIDNGKTTINPYDYINRKTIYIDSTIEVVFVYDFEEDEYRPVGRLGGKIS